nr:MAG TPA: hypothetical protein [Caudoviricetes sp.]
MRVKIWNFVGEFLEVGGIFSSWCVERLHS